MTAPDRPLVGDDRIEELARSVIEPLLLQAKEADEALYDPTHWVVPPSMTAEELAQKLAEAIRQAIREAGEAALHDLKRHLRAVIVAFSEVEPNPEDFQNVSAASQFLASIDAEWASAIRQRLP